MGSVGAAGLLELRSGAVCRLVFLVNTDYRTEAKYLSTASSSGFNHASAGNLPPRWTSSRLVSSCAVGQHALVSGNQVNRAAPDNLSLSHVGDLHAVGTSLTAVVSAVGSTWESSQATDECPARDIDRADSDAAAAAARTVATAVVVGSSRLCGLSYVS